MAPQATQTWPATLFPTSVLSRKGERETFVPCVTTRSRWPAAGIYSGPYTLCVVILPVLQTMCCDPSCATTSASGSYLCYKQYVVILPVLQKMCCDPTCGTTSVL
ncbi:hypothetical protein RRG08_016083 [Elysia crispata]|uniref:Uncharacterized protein n=1 Tax=Elysia crispata TaxID=231223 RepID=A0AAE0ZNX6_9GAST|nr:hypothetical protein RRG08_016083 [Elysia crispata]